MKFFKGLKIDYKVGNKDNYFGRVSKLENQYWHQDIKVANIKNFEVDDATNIGLIGYVCDEGVRRNQGRIGAKKGPKSVRNKLGSLPIHFENKTITDFGDVICLDDNQVTSLDLYDELEFTTENGVLYDYKRNECTNWEFVSGPSNLDLKSHSAGICSTDTQYTSNGTVDLTDAETGTYIFRYTVDPHYNCNGANCSNFQFDSSGCSANFSSPIHPCSQETALVTLVLTNKLYAGKDTADIELCADENPIDLISLLEVTNFQTVYRGVNGVWTDENDAVIPNNFVAPVFNFSY